jgi:UDP-2,3-diacylglucosamine pyrophosphatase LpxH
MDLYLSDLHLGNPLFKDDEKILELLRDDRFNRIFFIGDIFDVWEKKFSDIHAEYLSIINEINSQIKVNKKEMIFIKGNHDPIESSIKYACPQARIYSSSYVEKDVVIIHGNEFDGAILKVEFINKLLYYIFIWPMQRFFNLNVRDRFRYWLHSPAARKGKKHYDKLVLQIEKDAVAKYQDRFNFIIMGHTHYPKIVNCDNNTCDCSYINCGDWIHNRSYVIKDNEGIYRLEGELRGT